MAERKTVVVAGATGFVGSRVVPALEAAGYDVRAGTRNPQAAQKREPAHTWVRFDVEEAASMRAALAGADALVFLVHQMREHRGDLLEAERTAAQHVLAAAEAAGIRRIVYLGGPDPGRGASAHLEARLETGRVLRSSTVLTTLELQAAMIIGVGSESWLMVRDLARRLPIMVLPQWLERRSAPVGIDDVTTAIVRCVDLDEPSRTLPLPGPEILPASAILVRVAAASGVRPVMIPVPILTPRLSSHWIRLVTRADFTIARQLVDGLSTDLIPDPDDFWRRCPDLHPTPLDEVIRSALAREPANSMPRWQARWERWAQRVARRTPPPI